MKALKIKDSQISFERSVRITLILTLISVLLSYATAQYSARDIKVNAQDNQIVVTNNQTTNGGEEVDKITKELVQEGSVGNVGGNRNTTSKQTDRPLERKREVKSVGVNTKIDSFVDAFKRAGSPLKRAEIVFVYNESLKRKLDPRLVLAVMALESGWGKSNYCQNKGNCFGYGYTDSGKVGNFEGEFEKVTIRILDNYKKQGYGIKSASYMASKGYNFNISWVTKVNSILNSFKSL